MIKVLIGDIFKSNATTLVNTINCVGVMGKGIALEFKKRFPEMFKNYIRQCQTGEVKPGRLTFYPDMFNKSVLNFPTKQHWRSPSRLEDIIVGLDYFIAHYREWGIESVAFPPLGCGNGGLDWKIVGPLMYQKLSPLNIDVEIYAPFGTAISEITEKFLLSQQVSTNNSKGIIAQRLNPEWITLLETIYQLSKQVHSLQVGRTIFQKICYVLTAQGIETGFNFKQASYGPFSPDVKIAISAFANANLITEQQLGKMTAIQIGPDYERYRIEHADIIQRNNDKITKTVDLFCRIRDTVQAEVVTTVFYSIRELKKERQKVSEKDLYQYILNWKPHWNVKDKCEEIASAIRNLAMLKWISVQFSSELPVPAEI